MISRRGSMAVPSGSASDFIEVLREMKSKTTPFLEETNAGLRPAALSNLQPGLLDMRKM
jgi:hypothetical protein